MLLDYSLHSNSNQNPAAVAAVVVSDSDADIVVGDDRGVSKNVHLYYLVNACYYLYDVGNCILVVFVAVVVASAHDDK